MYKQTNMCSVSYNTPKALLTDTWSGQLYLRPFSQIHVSSPIQTVYSAIFFKDTDTLRIYKLDASFIFKLENKAERKGIWNEISFA